LNHAKRFDAAMKQVLEISPASWTRLLGTPTDHAAVIQADNAERRK
jgi:hypothetical protein